MIKTDEMGLLDPGVEKGTVKSNERHTLTFSRRNEVAGVDKLREDHQVCYNTTLRGYSLRISTENRTKGHYANTE
jgi:hypothetical protein